MNARINLPAGLQEYVIVIEETPSRETDGSYVMNTPAKLVQVFRNGLLQSHKMDYVFDAPSDRIVPKTPWAVTDVILVNYLAVIENIQVL